VNLLSKVSGSREKNSAYHRACMQCGKSVLMECILYISEDVLETVVRAGAQIDLQDRVSK
jgi:hypothetical protein